MIDTKKLLAALAVVSVLGLPLAGCAHVQEGAEEVADEAGDAKEEIENIDDEIEEEIDPPR